MSYPSPSYPEHHREYPAFPLLHLQYLQLRLFIDDVPKINRFFNYWTVQETITLPSVLVHFVPQIECIGVVLLALVLFQQFVLGLLLLDWEVDDFDFVEGFETAVLQSTGLEFAAEEVKSVGRHWLLEHGVLDLFVVDVLDKVFF